MSFSNDEQKKNEKIIEESMDKPYCEYLKEEIDLENDPIGKGIERIEKILQDMKKTYSVVKKVNNDYDGNPEKEELIYKAFNSRHNKLKGEIIRILEKMTGYNPGYPKD